ncbi:disease resistance protein RGA3 [Canna indica]|uniref:Disease resistance protein RGA3 n=1 Tax=Canna indica TaxID=4628 RepID=A0AAQ3KS75_9LILI|nr:disease resistance protein RGA3 [Canna indica]
MSNVDLRRILMAMLPSDAVMEQAAHALRIQKHLKAIADKLWAINAVIMDAELRAVNEPGGVVATWLADFSATLLDVEDLLTEITDRQSAPTSTRVAFCLSIVCKLLKVECRLKKLLRRGSTVLNLQREMMDSMDPCREEYYDIMRHEEGGGGER